MLDITAGPYQGWLSEELQRFTYLCVEKDTDLEGPRPDGVIGRVTQADLRTAPNRRMIKADTPRRYRWVGRDNSALRAELDDDLAGLQRQFDDISRRVGIARGTTRTGQARIGELEQIQKDLSWTDLDLEPTTRRLGVGSCDRSQADRPLGASKKTSTCTTNPTTSTLAEASALAAACLRKRPRIEQERILVSDAQYALQEARNLVALDFTEVPGHGQ